MEENFKLMMGAVRNLNYRRAVIPADAANLDINNLDFGDASKVLVCVRFLSKCGKFSCQLLFGKSLRAQPQPRAEMYAAVVNTHCGQVVKSALIKHQRILAPTKVFVNAQQFQRLQANPSGSMGFLGWSK